jgi:hypothetical protein
MSIVYDFKAIKAATLAFPEDRPQNVVEKPVEPESPAYSYSSGDLGDQPDYGMFAGWANAAELEQCANEVVIPGVEVKVLAGTESMDCYRGFPSVNPLYSVRFVTIVAGTGSVEYEDGNDC